MTVTHLLVILLVIVGIYTDSFNQPSTNKNDIGIFSIVSSNESDTNYCAGRNSTPDPSYVIKNITDTCKTSDSGPPNANTNNGYIRYNSTNVDFCEGTFNVTAASYTLTFWVKHTCTSASDCSLTLKSGSSSTIVKFKDRKIYINGTEKSNTSSQWIFVALRRSSQQSTIFIDNSNRSITLPQLPQILINPNLTNSEFYSLVDVRLFSVSLTDREITQIYNNTPQIEDIQPHSECRCSDDFPIPHIDSSYYSLLCKNQNGELTARFNPQSVLQFISDGNETTSWRSNNLNTVIKMKLDQEYQIDEVLIVVRTRPCNITITLDSGNQKVLSSSGSDRIRWTGVSNSISSRSDLEQVVTENITILLTGYCDIAEIKVTGRCNCNGNSDSCNYQTRNNICGSCSKNTTGTDCGQCKTMFYRLQEDFGCSLGCQCNTLLTQGARQDCEQVDGQCPCKVNVEGRQCDTCKPLHYGLSGNKSEGCTRSSCHENGTQQCNDNVNCSTCVCKPNVIGDLCDRCSVNHYGINLLQDGCKPCACNSSGSNAQNCTVTTGQCYCKHLVEGRQCDKCKEGYYGLNSVDTAGCKLCGDTGCNKYGARSKNCEQLTGQCDCIEGSENKMCDPIIEDMVPNFGPIAGGTKVTLSGHHFGSGPASQNKKLDIFMNPDASGATATIELWTQTRVVFITKNVATATPTRLLLRWATPYSLYEGRPEDLKKNQSFTFRENPEVSAAHQLMSFKSGGCDVRIQGTYLNSVYQPKLISYLTNGINMVTDCNSVGSTVLLCKSPNMSSSSGSTVTYGLIMDGLLMYNNLISQFPNAMINFTENPTISSQAYDDYKMLFSDTITVQGSRMKEACQDNLKITIGTVNCKVEAGENERIVCKPDMEFPGVDLDSADVMVEIGNFAASAGKIKFISFWKTWEFIGIAIGAGVFVILILVIVICCCCRRRRGKYSSKSDKAAQNGFDMPLSTNPAVPNDYEPPVTSSKANLIDKEEVQNFPNRLYSEKHKLKDALTYDDTDCSDDFLHKLESSVREKIQKSISDRKQILPENICTLKGTDIRIIKGRFGKGSPNADKDLMMKTNVKTLKELLTGSTYPAWINNGLLECMKFQDCFHDNILRSLGISVDQNRFYILYPATQRGFKEYLNDAQHDFTVKQLLEMCMQVAEGMKYLSDENMVHKDLATRNCLVMADGLIKISDSSFSWNLYPTEYMYDEVRQRYLPVRWMALESLKMGYYDISSDVWSFGVLLWEVMSLSLYLPYYEQELDTAIKDHIEDGYRLGMPTNAPEELYNLMVKCWDSDNHHRPSFDEVVMDLKDIMNPESIYVNLETSVAGQHNSTAPVPQRGATVKKGYRS